MGQMRLPARKKTVFLILRIRCCRSVRLTHSPVVISPRFIASLLRPLLLPLSPFVFRLSFSRLLLTDFVGDSLGTSL